MSVPFWFNRSASLPQALGPGFDPRCHQLATGMILVLNINVLGIHIGFLDSTATRL